MLKMSLNRQKAFCRTGNSRLSGMNFTRYSPHWNAKKVSETMCRPAALRYFRKQFRDADRVFLGDAQSDSLKLESNELLTGTGQVRAGGTWHYFKFSCQLNPRNGRAVSFGADITRSESYIRQSI